MRLHVSELTSSADAILESLRLFIEPGQVTELRAVGVSKPSYRLEHIEAGFFDHDHLDAMAHAAAEVSSLAKGVYFMPNPLNPDLLARICNRLAVARKEELASDKDVLRRRWMLVDSDPQRLAGVSATDAEKAEAWSVSAAIRDHLGALGWPAPIAADSGNGYHLLYRVDLPSDDGGLIQRCLQGLASQFGTSSVKVDTSVYNPARIVKLYGTTARKGDSTPSRPHRLSSVLDTLHAA